MVSDWIALAGVLLAAGINLAAYLVAWGAMKGAVAALTTRVAMLEGQIRALDELKLDVARLETRLDALIEHVRDLNASLRWMREPTSQVRQSQGFGP
jgi:hypothetical protein